MSFSPSDGQSKTVYRLFAPTNINVFTILFDTDSISRNPPPPVLEFVTCEVSYFRLTLLHIVYDTFPVEQYIYEHIIPLTIILFPMPMHSYYLYQVLKCCLMQSFEHVGCYSCDLYHVISLHFDITLLTSSIYSCHDFLTIHCSWGVTPGPQVPTFPSHCCSCPRYQLCELTTTSHFIHCSSSPCHFSL
jgi:hypothetical protein